METEVLTINVAKVAETSLLKFLTSPIVAIITATGPDMKVKYRGDAVVTAGTDTTDGINLLPYGIGYRLVWKVVVISKDSNSVVLGLRYEYFGFGSVAEGTVTLGDFPLHAAVVPIHPGVTVGEGTSSGSGGGGGGGTSNEDSEESNDDELYFFDDETNTEWHCDSDDACVGIGEIEVIEWWHVGEEEPYYYYYYYYEEEEEGDYEDI